MPDVVVAVAVIRSHAKQIGWENCTVPIAAGLIQRVCPCVAQDVGHAVPWPLRQGRLQPLVIAEILIRNVVDIGEIWELAEVRPPEVFASRAARSCRTGNLSRSVRSIARGGGSPRQPAGT